LLGKGTFFILIERLACLKRSKSTLNELNARQNLKKNNHVIHVDEAKFQNIIFQYIAHQTKNVAGAPFNPNGITNHSYNTPFAKTQ